MDCTLILSTWSEIFLKSQSYLCSAPSLSVSWFIAWSVCLSLFLLLFLHHITPEASPDTTSILQLDIYQQNSRQCPRLWTACFVLCTVWVQRVLHCRGSHHNPPCRCIKSEQCLPHLSDRTEKTQSCKNTDSPLCVEKKQLPLKSLFFHSLLYKWDAVNIVWTRIKGLYI